MSQDHYDLFVIGAGSGGVRAARLASQEGARVGIAESYRVGGTCVIRGCVPKKLFVYASEFSELAGLADSYGWDFPKQTFDWQRLITNKDKEIERLNQIYITNLEKAGVELFNSQARILSDKSIYLDALDQKITADKILIATGATPFMPEIKGIEYAISSNEAFHLEELPKSILIVGGGYIAVEFAGIFHGLGVKTTLSYRGEQILRGFDMDLRKGLAETLERKGLEIKLGQTPEKIVKKGSAFTVHDNQGQKNTYDMVMFATGRRPNVDNMGLEDIDIKQKPNGAIIVDHHYETSEKNIFAIGDVTDRMNLTPIAIREGVAFVETHYKDNPTTVDYTSVPTAVFSQPEIGTVGLDEETATKLYKRVEIYKTSFRSMKYSLSDKEGQTMMKLIVARETNKVVGCHILGSGAGEMIQLAGIALKMGATKADFDATVAVHPTSAEELVTFKEPTKRI